MPLPGALAAILGSNTPEYLVTSSISHSDSAFVRIVLADDHAQTRTGLRRQLERSGRIRVVGEATDGSEVFALLETAPAQVLLLDIDMGRMSGLDVMKQLSLQVTPLRVLGLSNYNDPAYVFEMLAYGASGYLSKEDPIAIIVKAVCRVADGARCQLSPAVWAALKHHEAPLARWPLPRRAMLQTREVIRLVAAGYPNPHIAHMLDITEVQIEATITQATTALTLHDRAELVAWGWAQGLIDPPAPPTEAS